MKVVYKTGLEKSTEMLGEGKWVGLRTFVTNVQLDLVWGIDDY